MAMNDVSDFETREVYVANPPQLVVRIVFRNLLTDVREDTITPSLPT
jgi:hypothetical protein